MGVCPAAYEVQVLRQDLHGLMQHITLGMVIWVESVTQKVSWLSFPKLLPIHTCLCGCTFCECMY